MVAIRGGIDSLGLLTRHALNWVDCSFATATATTPLFIQQGPLTRPPPSIPADVVKSLGDFLDPKLQGLLSRIRDLTRTLNSYYSRDVTPDEMWNFSHSRTLVEQDLLLLMPSSTVDFPMNTYESHIRQINQVVRLGAMTYVNLVLRGILPLSSIHITLSKQLAKSLDDVVIKSSRTPSGTSCGGQYDVLEILLWSAMFGGTVATDAMIQERQKSVVLLICDQLNISSWTQCRHVMESVVFSYRGCGDLCERFFERVMLRRA